MLRKKIGYYTEEEAEIVFADDVSENCPWEYNSRECDDEDCNFYGFCPQSIEHAARNKRLFIDKAAGITSKKLYKAARLIDGAGVAPEIPGRLRVKGKDYKRLLFDIKQTLRFLEPEQIERLDPFVLQVYSLIMDKDQADSEYFVQIPHSFFDRHLKILTGNEMKVLMAIVRHAPFGNGGSNFVGNATIADKAGVSPTNVDKTIRSLKKKGFLYNYHSRRKDGGLKNNWRVFWSPE